MTVYVTLFYKCCVLYLFMSLQVLGLLIWKKTQSTNFLPFRSKESVNILLYHGKQYLNEQNRPTTDISSLNFT